MAGDTEAFGQLVRLHQQVALRAAFLITRSQAEAEDAVQEGFVKAWKAMRRFKPDRPFRPWALKIVTNEARNRARSSGRRQLLSLRALPTPTDPNPEVALVEAEDSAALMAAFETLADADREVLSYRYFLELSEEETAVALGVARGTVKSRLNRARRRLESALDAVGVAS